MKSLIPKGTVVLGERILGVDQSSKRDVILSFEDCKMVRVDAVIGCDSIKGMTRKVMLESRCSEKWPRSIAMSTSIEAPLRWKMRGSWKLCGRREVVHD